MSTAQTHGAAAVPPPAHHVHRSNDPLPTRAALNQGDVGYIPESPAAVDAASTTATAGDHDASIEQRALDSTPSLAEGGVAQSHGGQEGLPEGKAGFGDKVVGKTEKVVGKAMKKPELHEKGELREAGGKAAAAGEARVPHN